MADPPKEIVKCIPQRELEASHVQKGPALRNTVTGSMQIKERIRQSRGGALVN